MRRFDLSPMFRSTVGFDRMMQVLDSLAEMEDPGNSYPPYNIEKTGEDEYRITMAVAGFGEEDLDITVQGNTLVVTGRTRKTEDDVQYLHRGIAGRAFDRRFELADFIKVKGARLENGLLHIDLVREVPEEKKPRTIKIESKPESKARIASEAA